jgi:riboflavin synthase
LLKNVDKTTRNATIEIICDWQVIINRQFAAVLSMFTGLIEAVCRVGRVERMSGVMRLGVDLGELAKEAKTGESIAISGVCLTVVQAQGGIASFDVSGETLAKSTLGSLRPDSFVNIERALRAADRLGGHIVQGHVDGTGTIKAISRNGSFADIQFSAAGELLDEMVVKGSVAVDGISLTIAGMDDGGFRVAVIPETLEKTTLGKAKIGDRINIETDIIAKMIKKQLDKILPQREMLTIDKLKELGF